MKLYKIKTRDHELYYCAPDVRKALELHGELFGDEVLSITFITERLFIEKGESGKKDVPVVEEDDDSSSREEREDYDDAVHEGWFGVNAIKGEFVQKWYTYYTEKFNRQDDREREIYHKEASERLQRYKASVSSSLVFSSQMLREITIWGYMDDYIYRRHDRY